MEIAREGQRGKAWTAKVRGKAGNTGLKGRRQVTPMWKDDPVRKNDKRWWRGCRGRRGLPYPGRT